MIKKYIIKKELNLEFRNNTSLFLITPTMCVLIIVFPILSENRFRVENDIFLIVELLFLIIFIWTPSHFWALSLYKSEDYRKAKILMLPITSGIRTTKLNIFIYALILFPIAILPFFLNYYGLIYLILAAVLSGYYVFISYKLFKEKDSILEKTLAIKLFGYSILYLFMIFTSILIDKATY